MACCANSGGMASVMTAPAFWLAAWLRHCATPDGLNAGSHGRRTSPAAAAASRSPLSTTWK